MAKSVSRGFIKYKSYLFVDKDPIMDAWATARSDAKMTYKEVQENGGPTVSTLRSWEHGNTRRPQFATIAAAVKTVGKTVIDLSGGKPRIR